MAKKKSTKKALLASVLALTLSSSMLVGTTFAWFTDSVTSGSNVIQTGSLDVEVEYTLDGKNWDNLDGANDLFQKGLWEPGHTELVVLKISNAGSLALKYNANLNIVNEQIGKTEAGEDIVLSEILTVSTLIEKEADVTAQDLEQAFTSETAVTYPVSSSFMDASVLGADKALLEGESDYVFIQVDMAETVGNEANHNGVDIPTIKFGVNVLATQYTYEEDSFDNQYDVNAEYDNPSDFGYEVVYIYNLDDFTDFGKAVNANSTYGGVKVANNSKVWVEVMSDIDMTDAPAIQGTEFSIGNGNNLVFCGVFDGNNHVISNYTISAAWTYNVSLFRTAGVGFTMCDITFKDCSATKTNNRGTGLIIGTTGGGATFDNVDLVNCTVNGYSQAGAYVGSMTEGALTFVDCDVTNVTITAIYENPEMAIFLGRGWSAHDYETSGVWVTNCTTTNCKAFINGVEQATVKDYNYTK
ncbi:MAG: hypothetical protein E7381_04725 [Clostridiales bacterium]|nr:hypothetical protein [Clostridiales bacterium]